MNTYNYITTCNHSIAMYREIRESGKSTEVTTIFTWITLVAVSNYLCRVKVKVEWGSKWNGGQSGMGSKWNGGRSGIGVKVEWGQSGIVGRSGIGVEVGGG